MLQFLHKWVPHEKITELLSLLSLRLKKNRLIEGYCIVYSGFLHNKLCKTKRDQLFLPVTSNLLFQKPHSFSELRLKASYSCCLAFPSHANHALSILRRRTVCRLNPFYNTWLYLRKKSAHAICVWICNICLVFSRVLSLSFVVLALDLFQTFVNPRLVDQNDSFPVPIIFFTQNVAVFDKTPMKVSLPKVSAPFT